MRPPGLAEVERARADGRWDNAYEGARTAAIPRWRTTSACSAVVNASTNKRARSPGYRVTCHSRRSRSTSVTALAGGDPQVRCLRHGFAVQAKLFEKLL